MAGVLGTIGSIIGIGSGAKNLFGGGQQGGSGSSKTYVPTGLGGADQTWQGILGQLAPGSQGAYSNIDPAVTQAFQQMLGVDTSGLTRAGQNAGGYSLDLANLAQQYQTLLQNQAGSQSAQAGQLTGAGNQLWQTALDPQKQLQQQLQQQTQDQSRASSSARGLGMSAEGAGLENDAMRNFMLQWQNQQLGRQATGLQGMTGAYNQAGQQQQGVGRDLTASMGFGAMAPGFMMGQGQYPFEAQMQALGIPFQAAGQYTGALGGAQGLNTNLLAQIIPYLNSGQGATNQSFGQQQTGLNNLTTGLGQLGNSNIWGALGQMFNQQPQGGGVGGTQTDPWAVQGYGT